MNSAVETSATIANAECSVFIYFCVSSAVPVSRVSSAHGFASSA